VPALGAGDASTLLARVPHTFTMNEIEGTYDEAF